jgi:hypothetical protein
MSGQNFFCICCHPESDEESFLLLELYEKKFVKYHRDKTVYFLISIVKLFHRDIVMNNNDQYKISRSVCFCIVKDEFFTTHDEEKCFALS